MIFTEISLSFLFSILILAWHWTSKKFIFRTKRRTLPGPISFPIIGSALRIFWESRNTTNFELFEKLCKKYGPVISFKAGVQNFIVVEDFETAKALNASNDWQGRLPNTSLYLELTMNKRLGILFGDKDHWKEIRNFTIRSLKDFGFGHLDNMENSLQDEISIFLESFKKKFVDKEHDVCLHYCFAIPTLNLVWKLLCGTRFSYDNMEMLKLLPLIEEASSAMAIGTKPMFAFPFLRYIPGATDFQHILKLLHELQTMFRNIITKRKECKTIKNSRNDYIDCFLEKIEVSKETSASKVYTEDQLIQTCVDLLLTSSDTTSNALEFAIYYMLKYPQVQKLVQEEIDTVIGRDRRPSITDRTLMPYTEATILEILRNANVVPLVIRCSTKETELLGCLVPQNSFGLINIASIHKDPLIWGDPDVFRPSRFIDENNNIINENKLLAFGGGKRLCVGYKMARASFFTFFTSLLQLYTFEPSVNSSLGSVASGFASTLTPFYCKVKNQIR